MYFNILKKDLKRKKTMNIILLIFIILSSMFVASSVNNIATMMTSLDDYFVEAGAPDYFAATMDKSSDESIVDVLNGIDEIDSYGIEEILYASPDNIIYNTSNIEAIKNTSVIMSFDDAQIKYFDTSNNVINSIEEGSVLVSGKFIDTTGINIGETIKIEFGDTYVELKVAGSFKDAMLGSRLMGMYRFMLNDNDYEKLRLSNAYGDYSGALLYINTDNTKAVDSAIGQSSINIIFNGALSMIKMTYVMDMIIAAVLLVVSICLILIAFVVLNFTISFTLTEEYREIGVMKAIGISNRKIRGLYLVKYLALSIVGSIIGLIISVPFGNMLIKSVSESIVMRNENNIVLNVICAVLVIVLIMLFSYGCTRKVKKYSAVDAIHSGTTGERFNKKGVLRLSKSKASTHRFMAFNDCLSSPKRYAIIIVIYSLCLLLLLILVNTVNTLKSGHLITSFGITESDVYFLEDDDSMRFIKQDGEKELEEYMTSIEDTLTKNDMSGNMKYEVIYKLPFSYGDNHGKFQTYRGFGTTTEDYLYYEGTAPQSENEIALTPLTAEKLGAKIGDTITLHLNDCDKELMVCALFQSMNYQGEGARIHEDLEIDLLYSSGGFAFQIDFTDNPNEKEILNRVQKLKDIFDTTSVYTADEYVEMMVGVASTLDSVRMLVIGIVIVVVILVTVLMERSFITKEKSEIAIMKAMGFKNSSIIKWHTMRFGIITIASAVIAILLSYPVTYITITPVFKMMGASFGIKYKIKGLEVFVLYPIMILIVSLLTGFITSFYTNKIKASDSSSIE